MNDLFLSRPVVTVATVIEREGMFLLVEEETRGGNRLNQPAGHLEPSETLPQAAARETLEETGWRVVPTSLIGVYRWPAGDSGETFIRFSFAGEADEHDAARPLDTGIVRALWLTYDEIVARRAEHRSPLVMRCIDDYRAGKRWPLAFVTEIIPEPGA
jgi:8-oxo-dGTP pyrophosphatase MutT (NUDIX family)